jgi:lipid-binding SYLF domain-containing protein
MGKGNAQQAAQKRERNAKKNATSTASSQLKSNEKALSIICNVCKVRFIFHLLV